MADETKPMDQLVAETDETDDVREARKIEENQEMMRNVVYRSIPAAAMNAACKEHLLVEYAQLKGYAEAGHVNDDDISQFLLTYATMVLAAETRMQNELTRAQMRLAQMAKAADAAEAAADAAEAAAEGLS